MSIGFVLGLGACATSITLADGTKIPADAYTRRHYNDCTSGAEPASCEKFADNAFPRLSPRWYEFMLKGCELGDGGACGEVAFAGLGSEEAARSTGNPSAADYAKLCAEHDDAAGREACRVAEQERAEATPPAPKEIAANIVKVVSTRCGLGPADPTATSRELLGDGCFAAAHLALFSLAPDASPAMLLATVQQVVRPLGRQGCDLGSFNACELIKKYGEHVDLAAIEARRERWVEQDVRRAEEARQDREAQARSDEETRQWSEQYRERSMQDLRNSNEAWRKQMTGINDTAARSVEAQRDSNTAKAPARTDDDKVVHAAQPPPPAEPKPCPAGTRRHHGTSGYAAECARVLDMFATFHATHRDPKTQFYVFVEPQKDTYLEGDTFAFAGVKLEERAKQAMTSYLRSRSQKFVGLRLGPAEYWTDQSLAEAQQNVRAAMDKQHQASQRGDFSDEVRIVLLEPGSGRIVRELHVPARRPKKGKSGAQGAY